jgi:heme/copper-type cytochrome/quinol oxidase subunit 2
MWSTVIILILTFAVLGLLLGFAAVYDSSQQGQIETSTLQQNNTINVTRGNSSGSAAPDEGTGG